MTATTSDTGPSRGYLHALTAARVARIQVQLASTLPSRRREALYDAAYSLGQLVGAGIMPGPQAQAVLTDAVRRYTTTGQREAAAHVIAAGLRHGVAVPHRSHSGTSTPAVDRTAA